MNREKHSALICVLLTIAILIPSTVYLNGCGRKVINEDKFVKIYTDYLIAKDTINSGGKNNSELLKKVLTRYGITEKQYYETIDYYNRNPKEWRRFFKKAIAYTDSLKKKHGTLPRRF